ncbi:cyclin-dependent kinase inhibitor 3-like [Chenopodium quinoa]|nr:cyclin-dependent kinase inhibitor 3-like [Chenopodium quinoa]
MGKYMKKGKITGDVAVMEIPQSSSLGVRTRARTLALQPNPELSYLQLRSRRLEKPLPLTPPPVNSDLRSRVRVNPVNSGGSKKGESGVVGGGRGRFRHFTDGGDSEDFHDLGTVEASFGENNLDFDSRERSTRESTPCSLIRDAETIGTPGSTTRPTCSTVVNNRRTRSTQRAIPTNPEMEEFFAGFEHHQQKLFIEKYNYDIKNDMPLPGRYEWVRVDK